MTTAEIWKGRVAVVTGAASGIGLGMARVFARNGINVALCDRRADALAQAAHEVNGIAGENGARAAGFETDVSSADSVEATAEKIEAAFGRIHIVCNNAGIALRPKPLSEFTLDDWNWILSVNLYGVIHGVKSFLPRIRKHGEGGHIVNTSSIAGFQIMPGRNTAAYSASKHAVLALSEGLLHELDGTNIGVSVLAPEAIDTPLYKTSEQRPERFGGTLAPSNDPVPDLSVGLHPDAAGRRVLRAILHQEFYIFTHVSSRDRLARRYARIINAIEQTEAWAAEEKSATQSQR